MKPQSLLIYFLAFIFLTASMCKKKPVDPIDQLPPETQTGANTFGCLVNGEIFKPGGAQLSGGSLQCNYQDLGSGSNGGYYFVIAGRYQNNRIGGGNSIGISTDSLRISEGIKLHLANRSKGKASGIYSFYTNAYNSYQSFDTDGNLYTGELYIKKLDSINQIVSGTFWFDAVSAGGQKAEIRNGRFDVHYTR